MVIDRKTDGRPGKKFQDLIKGIGVPDPQSVSGSCHDVFRHREIGKNLARFGNKSDTQPGDGVTWQGLYLISDESDPAALHRGKPHLIGLLWKHPEQL